MASKLYRCAPEHVRPVTASEAQDILVTPDDPSTSEIARHLGQIQGQGITQAIDLNPDVPNPVGNPGTLAQNTITTENIDDHNAPEVPESPEGQVPILNINST